MYWRRSIGSAGRNLPRGEGVLRFRAFAAPVAQLDRAPDYESGGRRFESFRVRHSFQIVRVEPLCGSLFRILTKYARKVVSFAFTVKGLPRSLYCKEPALGSDSRSGSNKGAFQVLSPAEILCGLLRITRQHSV